MSSERQLKRKIKDWKLEKNVKSNEMRVIVRKIQQREAIGKSTTFRVRGQPVDPLKIERWQKRCGEVRLNNDLTSPILSRKFKLSASKAKVDIIIAAPSTPSDISYDTVQDGRSPSPQATSPYQSNTTLFRSIDCELDRSSRQPLADLSDGCGDLNTLKAVDADVFSSHRHDRILGGQPRATRFATPASPVLSHADIDIFGENVHEELFDLEDDTPSKTPPSPAPDTFDANVVSNHKSKKPLGRHNSSLVDSPASAIPIVRSEATISHELQGASSAMIMGDNLPTGQNVTLNLSQPSPTPLRKRYRQTEELELLQRMNHFQAEYNWNSWAKIEIALRLAGILSLQGRYQSAEPFFKQCVDHFQTFLGERNPRTLVASSGLAHTYVHQGQLSKAEKLSHLVFSKASEVFRPLDRDFLCIKIDFAYCVAILGDYIEAERLLREAMITGGSVLPYGHPKLLACTRYREELRRIRDKLSEGEKILKVFVETKVLGREFSNHSQAHTTLVDIYQSSQKPEQTSRKVHETSNESFVSEQDQNSGTENAGLLTSRDADGFLQNEESLQFRDTINSSARMLWMKHPSVGKETVCFPRLKLPQANAPEPTEITSIE
jgi:tetratricopeptide (TPR) repeat protein